MFEGLPFRGQAPQDFRCSIGNDLIWGLVVPTAAFGALFTGLGHCCGRDAEVIIVAYISRLFRISLLIYEFKLGDTNCDLCRQFQEGP